MCPDAHLFVFLDRPQRYQVSLIHLISIPEIDKWEDSKLPITYETRPLRLFEVADKSGEQLVEIISQLLKDLGLGMEDIVAVSTETSRRKRSDGCYFLESRQCVCRFPLVFLEFKMASISLMQISHWVNANPTHTTKS